MIAYKCAKCGAGELEPLGDGRKAVCQYCFSVMVLPSLDPEAFNRATKLRQDLQFDQAEMAFERIVAEYPTDSESYWNLLLCRYGIEYVVDRDGSRVPTCHRMSYRSFLEDPDYKKALQYADGYSSERYKEEAAKIDRVLKRIAQISQTQPDYDIFISYKESDETGHRTQDSVIAQNIYDALKHKHPNLNIFLSRVTLKEVAAGMEYEPVIFSALNTAKLMLVVGTSADNMQSVWVRNEWSRYRRMMDKDHSKKMAVVFKGMSPVDFPPELNSFAIQATEAEGFYMQDLLRGIENLQGLKEKPKAEAMASSVYVSANSIQVNNLLKRASQEMADGNTGEARGYLRRALDLQADCAQAWWELLCLETNQMTDIDENKDFYLSSEGQKAWNMVERYAKGKERGQYEEQMQDYQNRWNAARNRVKTEELFTEIQSKTENGKVFDEYSHYCRNSRRAHDCLKIADGEQTARIRAFLEQYERNHEKFLELQEFKQTRPVDRIRAQEEYIKREKVKSKADKKVRAGLRHQNGFLFVDIFFSVVALAISFMCSSYFTFWTVDERIRLHLLPLIVGIVLFTTIVKLFRYRGQKTKKITDADWISNAMTALLPTIIAYFAFQYVIYLRAKVYIPALSLSCIFTGVVYLVALAVVLGAIALFFAGSWVLAGLLLFGAYALSSYLDSLGLLQEIPRETLSIVLPEFYLPFLGISAVILVLCILLYFRNKAALSACDRTEHAAYIAKQNLQSYIDGQLEPVIREYKPYVADKYLKDMQKEDQAG